MDLRGCVREIPLPRPLEPSSSERYVRIMLGLPEPRTRLNIGVPAVNLGTTAIGAQAVSGGRTPMWLGKEMERDIAMTGKVEREVGNLGFAHRGPLSHLEEERAQEVSTQFLHPTSLHPPIASTADPVVYRPRRE